MSAANLFLRLCVAKNIPTPVVEYVFAPPRKWRFDYAWPANAVALEVEGGAFVAGRHTRGAGFREDCEKYNEAAALGWRIVRVLPEQLTSPHTFDWITRARAA